SPIINKFSETHLTSCNVIQTTSLRIALGVPIWTPNIILLKLAGQEILSGKIKRLAIQFFIKQIATQPFSALFHTPDRIHSQLVEKDAESLRITFRNLSCIPDHIPWSGMQIPSTDTMTAHKHLFLKSNSSWDERKQGVELDVKGCPSKTAIFKSLVID
ncbi:hypothetical protein AVEN_259031-1, partial [Araneus ventricosus]